jgi:hypothetical protein
LKWQARKNGGWVGAKYRNNPAHFDKYMNLP